MPVVTPLVPLFAPLSGCVIGIDGRALVMIDYFDSVRGSTRSIPSPSGGSWMSPFDFQIDSLDTPVTRRPFGRSTHSTTEFVISVTSPFESPLDPSDTSSAGELSSGLLAPTSSLASDASTEVKTLGARCPIVTLLWRECRRVGLAWNMYQKDVTVRAPLLDRAQTMTNVDEQ